MTIKKLFIIIYSTMAIVLLVLMGAVLFLMNTLTQAYSHQETRYASYLLADELRQSSDDLTRFARTYAVSGNPRFEEMYWDVLAIRNGDQPRPLDYQRIYWDFVASSGQKPRPGGEQVPLRTLMEQLGFTAEELTKLQEAQHNSDALVWMETVAFNAIKGRYDDGTGNFTLKKEPDMAMARRLMHDQAYHDEKAKIMGPINEFFQLIDQRTAETVQGYIRRSNLILGTIVSLGVTMIALSIGSFAFIQNRVSRPIASMSVVAVKVAQGDITQEITVDQRDDLGHLADAFRQVITYQRNMADIASCIAQGDLSNAVVIHSDHDVLGNAFQEMITNLRTFISQAQQSADKAASAGLQLNDTAKRTDHASHQVAATSKRLAQGADQQTQSIAKASNYVEQTAHAAKNIADGAQAQAQAAQKTSHSIAEMANIVGHMGQVADAVNEANTQVTQAASRGVAATAQTSQGMNTIRNSTADTAKRVKEMGERSKEIGHIIETIDNIADQTDMVAINATIEAARAGEYGRGFAVVADQVRKLSEDSKEATHDINMLIVRVQETIDNAITAMEHTVVEVDHGAQLAKDTTRSLQEIMQAAEGAADLAGQINGATTQLRQKNEGIVTAIDAVGTVIKENTIVADEMAAGSQRTTAAMENVVGITEANSDLIESVSTSAKEIATQVGEIVASSEELSTLAEELHRATQQFQMPDVRPLRPGLNPPGSGAV